MIFWFDISILTKEETVFFRRRYRVTHWINEMKDPTVRKSKIDRFEGLEVTADNEFKWEKTDLMIGKLHFTLYIKSRSSVVSWLSLILIFLNDFCQVQFEVQFLYTLFFRVIDIFNFLKIPWVYSFCYCKSIAKGQEWSR